MSFGRLGSVGGGFLPAINGRFILSGDQAYTAPSPAKLNIATASFNNGLTADLVTNRRVTIIRAGIYNIKGLVYFTSGIASGDILQAFIYKNGSSANVGRTHASSSSDASVLVTDILSLAAGDYIELWANKTNSNSTFYAANCYLGINAVG
ncbi:MAG: hypothetical protein JSS22_03860 [Proteobacteria bacterium]|nr:hypothetical protein [Pseudomonadota bacterium]